MGLALQISITEFKEELKIKIMKVYFIILVIVLGVNSLHAQTFDEIFKQKKTQKKYLLQQIAALQIYIEYAQKGYSIARQGITAVGDLTKGELDLHSSYFSSLKAVNPAVKNYAMVSDIISLQVRTVKLYKSLIPSLTNSDMFNSEEMDFVNYVFDQVTKDCVALTEDLIDVTTNGRLTMTDDERLSRISELYSSMQKNYGFSKKFSDQALGIALSRTKVTGDAGSLSKLYAIKD